MLLSLITPFFLPNLATHGAVDNRGNKDYSYPLEFNPLRQVHSTIFHPSSTRSERGSVITTAMPIVIRLIRQLQQTSGSRTNSNPCCQLVNQEVLFGRKYPQLRLCTTAFLPEKSFLISSFEGIDKSVLYPSQGQVLTRYSPVRHWKHHFPFDLHVLSMPPAFILSQDRTLHEIHSCITYSFLIRRQSGFGIVFPSKDNLYPCASDY